MKTGTRILMLAAFSGALSANASNSAFATDPIVPLMSYTGQGTPSAKAVAGGMSLTVDCRDGQVVDQAGRTFQVEPSAKSAVQALGLLDGWTYRPDDRRFTDADILSSYRSRCHAGAGAAGPGVAAGSSSSGAGGSSGGTSTSRTQSVVVGDSGGVVDHGGGGSGEGTPKPGGGGRDVGVPFPVAGVGLPALLLAGAYAAVRRWRLKQPS